MDRSLFAFTRGNFGFQTELGRAKDEIQLRRADSENAFWLNALTKEHLAAITKYGLHGINFRLGCGWLWNDYWRHWMR